MKRIYLDNAASTPVDPRVADVLDFYVRNRYGNASSLHTEGRIAEEIIGESRTGIAKLLKCRDDEVYFTSGGTEANNWALKGFALANQSRGNHVIVSEIEHECILNAARWLRCAGFRVSFLPVDPEGRVDPDVLRKMIRPQTILISVMHVNNETGTIQPVAEIGRIAREHGIAFHTDACQSFGKIGVHPEEMMADMVSVNGHKIYGPKGIGALYVRGGTKVEPLLHGGGQESGFRSGTENVPSIAGFAKAVEICSREAEEENERIGRLREELRVQLQSDHEEIYFNGSQTDRIPGILNLAFRGLEGEAMRLLLLLDERGIAVSSGSACSANHGDQSGSHVLRAIGRNPVEARGALRMSIGRFNTRQELELFRGALSEAVTRLNPIYSI